MSVPQKSSSDNPLIIGIDPGTAITGYGIITAKGSSWAAVDFGCIRSPKELKLSDRYLIIYDSLMALLEAYQPGALAVETQFVYKNAQSALKLGMVRGIVILAAKKKGISVFEYTPSEAKRAVLGNGAADKKQVQWMIQRLLQLSVLPTPQDASDALALALCHAHTRRLIQFKSKEV